MQPAADGKPRFVAHACSHISWSTALLIRVKPSLDSCDQFKTSDAVSCSNSICEPGLYAAESTFGNLTEKQFLLLILAIRYQYQKILWQTSLTAKLFLEAEIQRCLPCTLLCIVELSQSTRLQQRQSPLLMSRHVRAQQCTNICATTTAQPQLAGCRCALQG